MAAPINRYAWKQSGLYQYVHAGTPKKFLSNAGEKEETIRKQRTNSYMHGYTLFLLKTEMG